MKKLYMLFIVGIIGLSMQNTILGKATKSKTLEYGCNSIVSPVISCPKGTVCVVEPVDCFLFDSVGFGKALSEKTFNIALNQSDIIDLKKIVADQSLPLTSYPALNTKKAFKYADSVGRPILLVIATEPFSTSLSDGLKGIVLNPSEFADKQITVIYARKPGETQFKIYHFSVSDDAASQQATFRVLPTGNIQVFKQDPSAPNTLSVHEIKIND